MNVQAGIPGAAEDGGIPDSVRDPKRFLLYVVSRAGKALADDIFAAMRRDMANASVELIYDRRVGERRTQSSSINQDRRRTDRRQVDPSKEIAAKGWARIEL